MIGLAAPFRAVIILGSWGRGQAVKTETNMEIPRNKPEKMLDAEWVARHLEFKESTVCHVGFLAELKSTMIDLASWEIQIPDARLRLRDFLKRNGYTPQGGFQDDPNGCTWPVTPESFDDLLSHERLDWMVNHHSCVLYGARDKFTGNEPQVLDWYPAWELTHSGDHDQELSRRWEIAGGCTYPSLRDGEGERRLALKNHPVWRKLGDPKVFPDGLGIDHPPFYAGSKLGWSPIDKTECVLIGVMEGSVSPDRARRYIERRLRRDALWEEALRRREPYQVKALYPSDEDEE